MIPAKGESYHQSISEMKYQLALFHDHEANSNDDDLCDNNGNKIIVLLSGKEEDLRGGYGDAVECGSVAYGDINATLVQI